MKTFFVLAIFICGSLCYTQTKFEFDGFTASNLGQLTLNGKSKDMNPNSRSYLTLTNNSLSTFGSGFYANAIDLSPASGSSNGGQFSTFFGFVMSTPGASGGADGIVFAINGQPSGNTVGATGCGIGYQCIKQSLGVEFDTYQNSKWASDCGSCTGPAAGYYHGAGYNSMGDNDNNHVGVNLNGDPASVVASRYPVSFKDGHLHYAWIDYDGVNIEVRIAEVNERPQYAVITYPVDIPTLLGSSNMYVGFTAGTGASSEYHNIVMWSFVNTYSPFGLDQGCSGEIHDDPLVFGYNGQRFLYNGADGSYFNIYNDNHGLLVNGMLSSAGTPFGNGSTLQQVGITTPAGHQITILSDANDNTRSTFTFLYDGKSHYLNKSETIAVSNCTQLSFDRHGYFVIATPVHKVYIYDVASKHFQAITNTFLNVHVNFIPQSGMKIGGLLGQTVSSTATLDLNEATYKATGLFDSSASSCGPYNSKAYDACGNAIATAPVPVRRHHTSKRDSTVGTPTCTIS